MSDWLSHLDPNVVVAIVIALVTYIDHRFLSPTAKGKLADALTSALDIANEVLDAIVASSPPGTTKAELEAKLWAALKTQLQHFGYNPDKLSSAITAMAQALVSRALASSQTAPPPVAAVAVVTTPPSPPAPSAA